MEIGGLPVSLQLNDGGLPLSNGYGSFAARHSSPRILWEINSGSPPFPLSPSQSHAGITPRWEVGRRDGKKLFCLRGFPHRDRFWKVALMEPDFARGEIWIDSPGTEADPLSFIDLLIWSHLLILHNGLIVHGAALKRGEEVYLFPAPSGWGKSTWSRLAAASGIEVLGDDKVVLRKFGEGYKVYGSPWNEYSSAGAAWLKGVFFLKPAPENRLERISPPITLKNIFQAAFLPFREREEMETVTSMLSGLAGSVPAHRFGFQPDKSAVDFWQARLLP